MRGAFFRHIHDAPNTPPPEHPPTLSWPKTRKVHQQRAAEKHLAVVYTTMWSLFSRPRALAASEKPSAVGSLVSVCVVCGGRKGMVIENPDGMT